MKKGFIKHLKDKKVREQIELTQNVKIAGNIAMAYLSEDASVPPYEDEKKMKAFYKYLDEELSKKFIECLIMDKQPLLEVYGYLRLLPKKWKSLEWGYHLYIIFTTVNRYKPELQVLSFFLIFKDMGEIKISTELKAFYTAKELFQ